MLKALSLLFCLALPLVGAPPSPPSASPCGHDVSTGKPLPIGMQLVGKSLDESTLLKAAWAYEQSTDWHKVRAK